MRDSLSRNNVDDFRQRYSGTFGWLLNPDTGKKLLVSILGVDRSAVRFKDQNNNEGFAYPDTGVMFEFLPVEHGWVNTAKSAYFMTRRPARQWHRGISHDNTVLYTENKSRLYAVGVSLEVLATIYSPSNPDFTSAVNDFVRGKRTVAAISKDFALLGENFYFYSKPVAKYKEGKIFLETNIIAQEVKDAIRKNNLPLEVVINA